MYDLVKELSLNESKLPTLENFMVRERPIRMRFCHIFSPFWNWFATILVSDS